MKITDAIVKKYGNDISLYLTVEDPHWIKYTNVKTVEDGAFKWGVDEESKLYYFGFIDDDGEWWSSNPDYMKEITGIDTFGVAISNLYNSVMFLELDKAISILSELGYGLRKKYYGFEICKL